MALLGVKLPISDSLFTIFWEDSPIQPLGSLGVHARVPEVSPWKDATEICQFVILRAFERLLKGSQATFKKLLEKALFKQYSNAFCRHTQKIVVPETVQMNYAKQASAGGQRGHTTGMPHPCRSFRSSRASASSTPLSDWLRPLRDSM